jgi:hypothetical protein
MKLHHFFQSLKGKDDVLTEILAGDLHVDYMLNVQLSVHIHWDMRDESA